MSRPVFWPTRDAQVSDSFGTPVAGQRVRIYAAQSGGSPITDLQRVDSSGAPTGAVASGILISDANGLLPAFAGPDGGSDVLFGDFGAYGVRLALVADPSSVGGAGGGSQFTAVLGKSSGTVAGADVLADATVAAALTAKLATTGTAADSAKVGGITVTGTPTAGQVPTATSGSAAAWATPASGAGDATTGAKGVVQLAGDLAGTAASPVVARVNGVTVTGTPTAGQVPTATSGTAAAWATPAAGAGDATTGTKGVVQLAGDLGGTAASPTVPGLAAKAPLASPALTGTPTAPTASALTNTTQVATTAYTDSATGVERTRALAAEALLAPLASPALTGTPTAPTAAGGTNTTQVATTAFVGGEIALKAPLASPALTGTPTVPTAAVDTSTTQAASTAFVVAQAASATPLIDGTAAVGTSTRYARGDHKHPTDTTRAAAAITVTAGTGLTGGGDLSANRTLAVAYGTTSTTAAAGDDTRITGAAQRTGGNAFTGTQDFTGATVTGISTSSEITAALNAAIGLNLMLGA